MIETWAVFSGLALLVTLSVSGIRATSGEIVATGSSFPDRRSVMLTAIAISLGTIGLAVWHGVDGELQRDEAVFVYTSSVVADGALPYTVAFDNTGPIGPWYQGLAAAVGREFGLADLHSTRLAYLPVGVAAVLLLFVVALRTGLGLVPATIGSMALALTPTFTREMLSGPRPKMLVLVAEVALVLALMGGHWLLAGVAVSFAALVWQPAGLLGLVAVAVAIAREGTRAHLMKLATGAALPLIGTGVLFVAAGQVDALIEGLVSWNAEFALSARPGGGLLERVVNPLKDLWGAHQVMWPVIAFGLAGLLWQSFRISRTGWKCAISSQPVLWIAGVAVLWLAWTLVDYQGVVDLFPFLPLASYGVALLFDTLVLPRAGSLAMWSAIGAIALSGLAEAVRTDNDRLELQVERIEQIVRPGDTFVSYSEPEALVILDQRNPSRFFFDVPGLDSYLRENEQLSAYVLTLLSDSPSVVGAPVRPAESSVEQLLIDQLSTGYEPVEIGQFQFWVQRG